MKIRRSIVAGSLLAGAAAFFYLTANASETNPDPQESTETSEMSSQTGAPSSAAVVDRLGDRFATLVGGEDNATSLATALHDGTAVTLTETVNGQATTATFTPAASLGTYGNVYRALALAEEQLENLGIMQPTPAQIEAALNGGSVTTGTGTTAVTTQLSGVVTLYSQKQSWSQIAQNLGIKPEAAFAHDEDTNPDPQEGAETGEAGLSGTARITDRIADRYATFAGSEDNATALVNGLRSGSAVNLTTTANGQTATTMFTPATGTMGYGEAALSLSLAQQDLSKAGISQPTPAQIEAALNGGSVTTGTGSTAVTTQLPGVLALRAQNQGWAQIAQTLGVTLHGVGETVAAANEAAESAQEEVTETSEHPADVETAESSQVAASEAAEAQESSEAAEHASDAAEHAVNAVDRASAAVRAAARASAAASEMSHFQMPDIPHVPHAGHGG